MNCGLRVSFAKYILFQIALFTELHPFLQQYYHIFIYMIKPCGMTYLIGNMGNIAWINTQIITRKCLYKTGLLSLNKWLVEGQENDLHHLNNFLSQLILTKKKKLIN